MKNDTELYNKRVNGPWSIRENTYHWDRIWECFNSLTGEVVLRDALKRHCVKEMKRRNKSEGK